MVSTLPLPYNTMASQCESLGTCARKKLSNWLAFENHYSQTADKLFLAIADNRNSAALEKVYCVSLSVTEHIHCASLFVMIPNVLGVTGVCYILV